MLDSDALRTFAAFAEDASLSSAARRLHLSQPAVHAQLKRLADEIGAPLYRRSGRGLALTREGAEVAAFARDIAERTADLLARVRGERAAGDARVILAAGAGALLFVLGAGMRAFARERAERLDVITADGRAAIEAVTSGSAHVGVAAIDGPPPDVEAHQLTDVPQVLVVPRAHRLAKKRRVSIADLDGERLVLPPPGRPQRATLDAAFTTRGISVRAGALAVGWELVVHLVSVGAGLAIVNGSVRLPRGLVARPVPELPWVRYQVFTRPRPRAAAAALVRLLVQHGKAWESAT
jgi:LysR family transcriptional regulator, low CO2-responsive transcriptional regulator